MASRITWAYGVTTVPQRRDNLLPKTLHSLIRAGYPDPILFIDGDKDGAWYGAQGWINKLVCRYPTIRTFGNWALTLAELYIRQPAATYYAVFQDDIIACSGLRAYLEQCQYPKNGYWNLYTFPSNEVMISSTQPGWFKSALLNGGPEGFQTGRGALGLVFDLESVIVLLTSKHFVERPQDAHRGHRAVDGGVVTAMNKAGRFEYVHNPSLLQHTGDASSMGSKPHRPSTTFRGENWDACSILNAPRQ